jgi:hypothetical protein
MKLWLDDVRDPVTFGRIGWHWVRTANEAMAWLAAAQITEASLDHDLGWEATLGLDSKEKTGYDVVLFLEENPHLWPRDGVHVHSANPVGSKRMQIVIDKHYGSRIKKSLITSD